MRTILEVHIGPGEIRTGFKDLLHAQAYAANQERRKPHLRIKLVERLTHDDAHTAHSCYHNFFTHKIGQPTKFVACLPDNTAALDFFADLAIPQGWDEAVSASAASIYM